LLRGSRMVAVAEHASVAEILFSTQRNRLTRL
jgi:hypothetical protein